MELAGKKAVVVGLGRSGEAATELLLRRGANVVATDQRSAKDLGPILNRLRHAGAELAVGGHSDSLLEHCDLVVVSPGVPRKLPLLARAQERHIAIIGELELASRFIKAPIIAITGTNGKSTTTTFTGHLLRGTGRRVFVGGNLGTPLCRGVDDELDVVVVEVSSFQLEWAPTFRPHIAVLLNITEDHLDRYQDFSDYARTKGLLFANQNDSDFAIINQEDALALSQFQGRTAPSFSFGHSALVTRGIRHMQGSLWVGQENAWTPLPLVGFKPRGRHNIENLMAATMAVHLYGVPLTEIADLIPRLEGLPHRLELVRELEGVRYYNDSKATNVASVVCSLRDFQEKVVLLMGGRDKGGSYAPLEPILQRIARVVIVYGEARPLIMEALAGKVPLIPVDTLEQAIHVAQSRARPGDSVVLSPACSSYDQFPNYEVRGAEFRLRVGQLAEGK